MVSREKFRAAVPPCLPETEIAAAQACWRDALSGTLPELAGAADVLLVRISPPHWALEWSLPRWLGDALGIPPAQSFDLVLGNMYGLAYVRLHDDLVDGDVPSGERSEAQLLATTFFHRWLAAYIGLFGGDPTFWDCFERYLGQWQRAMLASYQQPSTPLQAFTEADFLALGHRGAPLKICAASVCLLGERQDLLPQLEALLDTLLIGAVLLDHVTDWDADLAVGRPNAFVAHASSRPQIQALRGANRLAVLNGLATGATRSYFALIRRHLQAAMESAQALGLSGLADYIAWLRSQVAHYDQRLTRSARLHLRAAVAELFAASGQE